MVVNLNKVKKSLVLSIGEEKLKVLSIQNNKVKKKLRVKLKRNKKLAISYFLIFYHEKAFVPDQINKKAATTLIITGKWKLKLKHLLKVSKSLKFDNSLSGTSLCNCCEHADLMQCFKDQVF